MTETVHLLALDVDKEVWGNTARMAAGGGADVAEPPGQGGKKHWILTKAAEALDRFE